MCFRSFNEIANLSAKFRDSIYATRQLGMRYDALRADLTRLPRRC